MNKFGYIISNGYINMEKMGELVFHFEKLFSNRGVKTETVKTDRIFPLIGRDGNIKIIGIDKPADFILFWDKDIMLAKLLEKAGYRLFNCSKAIEICDNKIHTHDYLSNSGIMMPKTIQAPLIFEGSPYYDDCFMEIVEGQLKYPMIVKEAYGSFGQQVYLCNSREEVKQLSGKLKYRPHLFQEFISESRGRDIRIFIVGGKIVASMLRENKNDFRANISNGGKMTMVTPPKEYCEMALKAAGIIGLDYCGADILIGKDYPMLCEMNSNAHFKNIQICSGIDVADHFVEHILHTV